MIHHVIGIHILDLDIRYIRSLNWSGVVINDTPFYRLIHETWTTRYTRSLQWLIRNKETHHDVNKQPVQIVEEIMNHYPTNHHSC